MARGPARAVTPRKGFAARGATGDHTYESGAPIDLGITLSIYGKGRRGTFEIHDNGSEYVVTDFAPVETDTWPTEH